MKNEAVICRMELSDDNAKSAVRNDDGFLAAMLDGFFKNAHPNAEIFLQEKNVIVSSDGIFAAYWTEDLEKA